MFKNRFILVVGVFSLLLITIAVSGPLSNSSASSSQGANDFYQRHPEMAGADQNGIIPLTGSSEASDYFQRYLAQKAPASAVNMTDYFARHPELSTLPPSTDLSDYFLRH